MKKFVVLGIWLLSLLAFSLLAGCGGDTVNLDGLFGGTDAGVDATAPITDAGVDANADAGPRRNDAGGPQVTLGGVVLGLSGSGLVLANGGENLSIAANGAFTFATPIAEGAGYAITVASQPSSPTQTCTVTNGSGTAGASNIVDVSINCATSGYTLGGTVSGLTGTALVLENNFGDDLSVTQDGAFTFATKVPSGNQFNVTVKTQPSGQTCSVNGGIGVVGSQNIASVHLQCGAVGTYAIGGQISGLSGSVVLQNNGGDTLTLTTNGTFAFPTTVLPGTLYSVSVSTQPTSPSQTCTVSAGVGLTTAAPTTSVRVVCVTNSFPISVSVTGLVGTGLVLQDNGGDNLSITGNGTQTFATPVLSGHMYNVTVLTPPTSPAQQCTVASPMATVGNAAPPAIQVTCSTTTYAVKASVSGLANTTLTLTNGADSVTAAADGTYTFATRLVSGAAFHVQIAGQNGPASCSISGNMGNIGTADVTAIVNCTVNTYTVSGSISGLVGNFVLQNEGSGDQTVSGTTFSFPAQPNGSAYSITVLTQPSSPSQSCAVKSGSGSIAGAPVINVSIACTTTSYAIKGTVFGLAGTGLVVNDAIANATTNTSSNATYAFPNTASGTVAFQFAASVASGSTYHVTVATPPSNPAQTCTVTNGDGAVGSSDVTNLTINCTTASYTLSGTVSDLVGSGLYLQDNSTDTLHVLGNGTFSFNTPIASGGSYSVQFLQQPSSPTQSCVFTNSADAPIAAPSGTVHTAADVPTIYVKCSTTSFNVGGTISGLAANDSVTLLDNGGDSTVITGNGTFQMNTKVPSNGAYLISIGTPPGNPPQTCSVSGGSGTVGSSDVTSVAVNCATQTYTVGGTLNGLAGGAVVLQNNNGDNLTLAANGSFAFATPLATGTTYSAAVITNPTNPTQTCAVTGGNGGQNNGTGTVGTSNDASLVVTCTTTSFTIFATVTGLSPGNTVTLQDNGADTQTIGGNSPPNYPFATQIPSGNVYDITVQSQSGGSDVSCSVASGVGIVRDQNVTVSVTCVTSYTIGGTVTGLAPGENVVLQDNGGDNLTVAANGSFTFATRIVSGQMYAVSVLTNPSGATAQTCAVTGGSDTATSDVTSVVVTCFPATYKYIAQGSTAIHECAIATNGTLWCWGRNAFGQLGDGTINQQQLSPEQIGTANTWTSVVVGGAHTCGLQSDGTLWCWGLNSYGELGDGTNNQQLSPEQIGTANTWISLAAGFYHTCGVQSNGTLWCWGYNASGQLGDGTTNNTHSPEQIGTATTWSSLSAGIFHTCGLQSNGTLSCWGDNDSGQLGDGSTNGQLRPESIGAATIWSFLSAGLNHTCGIQSNGTLWCWGDDSFGQLGDGTDSNQESSPEQIGAATSWKSLAAGYYQTCGLQSGGTLWCWGDDSFGQLGDGSSSEEDSPERIGTATWTSLSATGLNAYGSQAGAIFSWGLNNYGEIGDGTTTQRNVPVSVP